MRQTITRNDLHRFGWCHVALLGHNKLIQCIWSVATKGDVLKNPFGKLNHINTCVWQNLTGIVFTSHKLRHITQQQRFFQCFKCLFHTYTESKFMSNLCEKISWNQTMLDHQRAKHSSQKVGDVFLKVSLASHDINWISGDTGDMVFFKNGL